MKINEEINYYFYFILFYLSGAHRLPYMAEVKKRGKNHWEDVQNRFLFKPHSQFREMFQQASLFGLLHLFRWHIFPPSLSESRQQLERLKWHEGILKRNGWQASRRHLFKWPSFFFPPNSGSIKMDVRQSDA